MIIDKIVNIYVEILNFLYKYTKNIPSRIRNIVITICCSYFVYYKFEQFSVDDPFFVLPTKHWLIVLTVLFGLFIIFSNDRQIEKPKYNKLLVYLVLILVIGILLRYAIIGTDIGTDINRIDDTLFLLTVFYIVFILPFVYIVWNNRKDYETFFDRLAFVTTILGVLYFINLFFLANKGNLVIYKNGTLMASINYSTRLGIYCSSFAGSSLYLLYRYKNNIIITIFECFSLATSITMLWWTVCRTALLALILSLFSFFIFSIKDINKNNYKEKIKNGLCLIALTSIFLFASFSLKTYLYDTQIKIGKTEITSQATFNNKYSYGKKVTSNKNNTNKTNEEKNDISVSNNDNNVNKADEIKTDAIINNNETNKDINNTINNGADTNNNNIDNTNETSNNQIISSKENNTGYYFFQSSRIQIWQSYIDEFNILGNHGTAQKLTPHNAIVEFTYKFGIPLGIVYSLLLFIIGFIAMKMMIKKKTKNDYYLFSIINVLVFAMSACFDHASNIFVAYTSLCFCLTIIPFFNKQ